MPTDLDYAKVMQRLGLTVGDGSDPDETPDTIWCDGGTVQLVPLNTYVKVADGSPVPWTGGNAVIECSVTDADFVDPTGNGFDGAGYLLFNGKPYVWVVDLSSPKVNPTVTAGATHRVNYVGMTAGGTAVSFPSVNVRITAAGDGVSPDSLNDLTILSPVDPLAPVPITKGDKGDPGGPGPIGDVTPEALAAKEAAETAQADAEAAAATATTKADEASADADAAALSASTADTAKTDAEAARNAAQGHANTANTKAGEAAASADSILGAVDDAEAAANTANTKAGEAVISAGNAANSEAAAHQSALDAAQSASEAAAGGVQKVNGLSPDGAGNVTLGAADVGARPAGNVPWTEVSGKPTFAPVATSGSASDITTGTLPTSVLPPLAINETFPVASQAAMLALVAQRGDMAIRSDNGRTYVLSSDSPSTLADWKEVMAAGQVQSVAGKTGVVSLSPSDVGAATAAQGTKADTAVQPGSLAAVATTGAYSSLSGTPTLGDAAAKNTGTGAGTVAAGNDSRITGAVQNGGGASTLRVLTQAAYNAIGSKDANTVYVVVG